MPFIRYKYNKPNELNLNLNLERSQKKINFAPKNFLISPHFGNKNNVLLNTKTFTMTHLLIPFVRYNFKRTEWIDLVTSLNVLIVSRNIPLTPFWNIKIFLQKKSASFFVLIDPPPFLCWLIPHLFCVDCSPPFPKNQKKRNDPILRKWCRRGNGRADWQTEGKPKLNS